MRTGLLIVKPAGGDFEDLIAPRPGNSINEAVLVGNPASPPSRKVSLEWLRFSDPLKGGSPNVFDHRVQPTQNTPVWREPVLVIFLGAPGRREMVDGARVGSVRRLPPGNSSKCHPLETKRAAQQSRNQGAISDADPPALAGKFARRNTLRRPARSPVKPGHSPGLAQQTRSRSWRLAG